MTVVATGDVVDGAPVLVSLGKMATTLPPLVRQVLATAWSTIWRRTRIAPGCAAGPAQPAVDNRPC
ncbi:MAG: hypothetical protein IPK19_25290 [Chloroflexi bacterium]|nr:hypothetical protein [Chloroflexota bacterium]